MLLRGPRLANARFELPSARESGECVGARESRCLVEAARISRQRLSLRSFCKGSPALLLLVSRRVGLARHNRKDDAHQHEPPLSHFSHLDYRPEQHPHRLSILLDTAILLKYRE